MKRAVPQHFTMSVRRSGNVNVMGEMLRFTPTTRDGNAMWNANALGLRIDNKRNQKAAVIQRPNRKPMLLAPILVLNRKWRTLCQKPGGTRGAIDSREFDSDA